MRSMTKPFVSALVRCLAASPTLAAVLAQEPEPPARPAGMLLPQAVVLPRGAQEITIDGSLIDWPQLPGIRLDDRRQLSGTAGGAWRGPADTSAFAFLMWDEQSLYVAVSVKDEWHRALDASTLSLTEIPAADSILLSFDPERNTRSNGPDPGRSEDRDFWLAEESSRAVVQWDRLRGTARVLPEGQARCVVVHDKEQGITSYEARIPWIEILPPGTRPRAGLCLDAQIVVNDFDESTDSMPQTRIGWTFGHGPVVDPGLLGSIMLVDDRRALEGVVPEFPPKPAVEESPLFAEATWRQLTARLLKRGPALYDGSLPPEEVGGVERLRVLEEIDSHCERFPRVDFIELHQRIHRRMNREVAGLMGRGLPWWWRERIEATSKAASDPVPAGTARIFKVPMGGWLVRSNAKNFVVDAAGNDLAAWLWGGTEFYVLTHPLDMTRRNDQLIVRMFAAEPPRPIFAHVVFHLPSVAMSSIPIVSPGRTYGQPSGTQVTPLCRQFPDGTVPVDCSYLVALPGGPDVAVVSPTCRPEDVAGRQAELVILSPRNVDALAIVEALAPGVIVVDESLLCQLHPAAARVSLADVHAFQRALLPRKSVVLAPGESWDVSRRR
jgi:hypothetical protein